MRRFLVSKYLRFDKSQPFISISAFLAFLGVAVGVMVLLVAMAIMNGFDKEFQRKLFTMNYPITVTTFMPGGVHVKDVEAILDQMPHLKASPYISSQVMLRRGQKLEGALMFGVDMEKEKHINTVVAEGMGEATLEEFEFLAGKGIVDEFLLEVDERLMVLFTHAEPGGLSLMPKMKRFSHKATFQSGLLAYDKTYMYTPVSSLAKVLGYAEGAYDGVHLHSSDPFKDIEILSAILPSHLRAVGWWQQNGNFFSALALEKRALFIVLMLIILVASLNIISSLLMTVMNRRQEIALLLSLGVYKREIKQTFFILGIIIGGSGVLLGVCLGGLGIWLLGSFDIVNLPADVYGSARLPLELSLKDFWLIVLGAGGVVAFSSYYPAKKATQVNVLETLRNE
ncbi:ABC transporter permease [Sulfurospirillum sp. T05]|uniref:ABC transporter permease n=1 Tax=Sulfurospirillum tamanense TaxID=2813362 RepID=A0ABS2WS43_9BACT|nr:ABC transporter permease [Sulfurospirillum tamanensis]